MEEEKLGLYYFTILDHWKLFCEYHSTLFDLTCIEYEALLKSDIDHLEKILLEKEAIVKSVDELEKSRQKIIEEINTCLTPENKINNVGDLISLMNNYENKSGQNILGRMNKLLINIIETIGLQNKKNQIFLNKAIHNLSVIKKDVKGVKTFYTYDDKGVSNNG